MPQIETEYALDFFKILTTRTEEKKQIWEYRGRSSDGLTYQSTLPCEHPMEISIVVLGNPPVVKDVILRFSNLNHPETGHFDLFNDVLMSEINTLLEVVLRRLPDYEQAVLSFISENI